MADEVIVKSQENNEIKNRNIGKEKGQYAAAEEYNVLHDYRSYNYVITLSALTREQYNSPDFFKKNPPLNYIVLKSSGKGVQQLKLGADFTTKIGLTEVDDEGNSNTVVDSQKNAEASGILSEFNSNGYGRFDFFIDNLEIDTLWNMTTGAQPSKIRFDVFEPFSINGFIEAVRVNALAAGFENHLDCPFALKIEFIGYPHGDGLPGPSVVPKSTRYFPVNINQMTLETSERGTMYKVACTSKNGMGLGEDGKLATTAKMKGANVKEVLESLMDQLTEARKQDSGTSETKNFNEFKISFIDGPKKTAKELESAEINDFLRSNQVYVMPDPSDANDKSAIKTTEKPTKAKYDRTKETITFNSGASILDVITAVIRDSKYTEVMLGTLDKVIKENNGLVPWFRVTLKSEIKPGKNNKTSQVNYIYTYEVRPYMTHYSKLPGMGAGMFDADELKGQIRRSYNYLYTGKNVDILNFNLKFNNLYFQQRPYKMGNKDVNGTASAAAAAETKDLSEEEVEMDGKTDGQSPMKRLVVTSESSQMPIGGVGKDFQASSYFKLAHLLHETLLDSTDLQDIRLSILGDPYYLVTSSIGNQEEDEDPEKPGITTTGQAPYLGGDVFIDLNFRTPKDIKSNGWADFGDGLLPFSGIYKVTNIVNTFKEGKFEQQVSAYRLAGQVKNSPVTVTAQTPKEEAREGDSRTKDTASADVPRSGSRASTAALMNLLSRGLPTAGLPGLLSNFTNAVGGAVGGVGTSLQTTLQRVDTAVADALAPVNGALQQAQSALNTIAQVGGLVAAGQALINGFDAGGAPGLSNPVGGYNPYSSGIRVNTDGLSTPDTITASIAVQSRIVSSFIQDSNNLRILNQNYYNNVLSERIKISEQDVSNVGNRSLEVTNTTPVDPKALAYKLGIDPKELSGMSGSQQSNLLAQLSSLASKIPENTDLAGLKALGISLANIHGINIPNLPALQPLTTAPLANVPSFDLKKILASGGNSSNLPGALTIPGIAAFLALVNSNKNIPNNGIVGGAGQLNVQSTLDKVETAQGMSINLTASASGNFSPAQLNLGSVESVMASNRETVQGYGGYYVISKTSYSQFGTQRTPSPIDNLMKQQTS